MKYILFFVFFVFSVFSISLLAQDVDFYLKNNDDNLSPVNINPQMSFEEYEILSSDFRMQDMMFSAIVPGYVHFKAKDNVVGYSLLAISAASYATFGYQAFWVKKTITDSTLFYNLLNYNSLSSEIKRNSIIMGSALFLITSTYVFDVIHGKFRLQKKQNAIRYKYNFKASISTNSSPDNNFCYNLGLRIYF